MSVLPLSVLVDTNILAELARPRPDPGVLRWAAGVTCVFLSAVTVEEIAYGLAWRPNARIAAWFAAFLERHATVLPVDQTIAEQAGAMRGRLQRMGKPRTQADMLIAATAAVHDLTLVTRNERDFEACGIRVLNPFR